MIAWQSTRFSEGGLSMVRVIGRGNMHQEQTLASTNDSQEMFAAYEYLVFNTVRRMDSYIPPYIEKEDLWQVGRLALWRAIRQFDPSRGTKFTSYAIAIIRGDIRTYLACEDWVPRLEKNKRKAQEKGDAFANPVIYELVSFEDLLLCDEEAASNDLAVEDKLASAEDVEATVIIQIENKKLYRVIDGLPPREKRVIKLYYWHGLNWKQIGKQLGVTESRAWQLNRQAHNRLAPMLASQLAHV